jgi:Sugar-binding N-terminal domain/Nucleotide-binding C-terminal domain
VKGQARPLVVLDDDPTGVQTLAGVRVLLAWDPPRLSAALEGRPAVHLITNSRALPPEPARTLVESAARTALAGAPGANVILRGDSTLRGHLLEEYAGLRDAVAPHGTPPLLLVPALPSAGRVTIAGTHMILADGRRVPLHETEYARDGVFAYGDARLLAWAEERSGGFFRAAAGRELPLAELRERGPAAVAESLAALAAAGTPAVLAPDAETAADLELIARGYAAVVPQAQVLVRCAPAFAGVLAGTTAAGLVETPRASDGVLVVCGSYVPASTRQLARLARDLPGAFVEVDADALASAEPDAEIARAAGAASALLQADGIAVLATPRERSAATRTLEAGSRVASALARIAGAVEPRPGVVVAKGGITAAVTLRDGFGAQGAEVIGPVLPGVSRWRAGTLDYLVVPGNVGGDELLADVVAGVLGR